MKKYYLIITLLLLTQCDYKPIYSQNNQNFGIKIIEFNENKSNKILATRLKNYSYKKDNIFLYELRLKFCSGLIFILNLLSIDNIKFI